MKKTTLDQDVRKEELVTQNPLKKAAIHTGYAAYGLFSIGINTAPFVLGAYKGMHDAAGTPVDISHWYGPIAGARAADKAIMCEDKKISSAIKSPIYAAIEFGVGYGITWIGTKIFG